MMTVYLVSRRTRRLKNFYQRFLKKPPTNYWCDIDGYSVYLSPCLPSQRYFCAVFTFRKDKTNLSDFLYNSFREPFGQRLYSLETWTTFLEVRFNVKLPEAFVSQLREAKTEDGHQIVLGMTRQGKSHMMEKP